MSISPKAASELRTIGYKPTLANLKTFQEARGLEPSGELNPETLKELSAVAEARKKHPNTMLAGMKTFDIWKMERDFKRLGINPGEHDGVMDQTLLKKIVAFKEAHPVLKNVGHYAGNAVRTLLHKIAPPESAKKTPSGLFYPTGKVGTVLGRPGQGTHLDFPNWETRNGVDIGVPKGTPIYAVADGVIGSQIGPIPGAGSETSGNRLHLETKGNEFYYQHLSKLETIDPKTGKHVPLRAGMHVHRGQLLGYSGLGNGVPHLHFSARNGKTQGGFVQTDDMLGI